MPFLELEGSPDLAENPRQLSGETTVGSGSQAAWRVQNKDLAARHFVLRPEEGGVVVAPSTPQNIVILNGEQVPTDGTPVKSGDVIGAGSARFIYLQELSSPRPKVGEIPQGFLIDGVGGKGYALRKRVVQIGREIGCSIVLKDPTVSRFHADVRGEGGEYVLYSMGSSGTRVNGEPVADPRMLKENDRIQIGETTFVFTKNALPPDVTLTQFEDHTDDKFARRATVVDMKAVTPDATYRRKQGGKTGMWVALAVVVVIAAGAYWLLFR